MTPGLRTLVVVYTVGVIVGILIEKILDWWRRP